MDDLVAVRVRLLSGEARYFITYGRIQDPVDPAPLEEIVLRQAGKYSLEGDAVSAELCTSLREASDEPRFYEALYIFSQEPIPFAPGRKREKWRQRIDREMRGGKHLYYLGAP